MKTELKIITNAETYIYIRLTSNQSNACTNIQTYGKGWFLFLDNGTFN